MAGISEQQAEARDRQGRAFARHLGVKPGSKRYNAIRYGTKRAYGWKPSREVKGKKKHSMSDVARHALRRRMKRK